jgi:hypothetical protein
MPQNRNIGNVELDASELMKHVTVTVVVKNLWRLRIARPLLMLFVWITNCKVEFEIEDNCKVEFEVDDEKSI